MSDVSQKGARQVVDATGWAARVGSRVVVRHRLPGGGLTDSVGELVEAAPGHLRLLTRTGEERVAVSDVVLSRVVPPRAVRKAPPHRALAVADLQRVMSSHWRAREQEPLGGWVLRASAGFTDRADSVLTAGGDPGVPLPEALDAVRSWYARHGLPPQLALAAAVPDGVPYESDLAAGPAAAGWRIRPGAGALVLTAPTTVVTRAGTTAALPPGLRVEASADLDPAWLAVYHYLGAPVPPVGQDLLRDVPEVLFVSVRDETGRALAVARGSLAEGWGAVSAVETRPDARRQGLARVLLGVLGSWFLTRRAAAVVLQTAIDNTATRQMYLDLGFRPHHRSDYWEI